MFNIGVSHIFSSRGLSVLGATHKVRLKLTARFCGLMLVWFVMPISSANAQNAPNNIDWQGLLQQADSYRMVAVDSLLVSRVSVFKQGELETQRTYHVYNQDSGTKTLVIFKSADEQGQKMLMLDNNYWLLMPKARRPIRITAMQKLLGDASVGDLSTLSWSKSYEARWLANEVVETLQGHAVETYKLQLKSLDSQLSYAEITLWLQVDNALPIQSDMYLASGKLAKQVKYLFSQQSNGEYRIVAMEFADQLKTGKRTKIDYLNNKPAAIDNVYFNPAYLSRHGAKLDER